LRELRDLDNFDSEFEKLDDQKKLVEESKTQEKLFALKCNKNIING